MACTLGSREDICLRQAAWLAIGYPYGLSHLIGEVSDKYYKVGLAQICFILVCLELKTKREGLALCI